MSSLERNPVCELCPLRDFCENAPKYIDGLQANIAQAQDEIDSFDPKHQEPPAVDEMTIAIFDDFSASLQEQAREQSEVLDGSELTADIIGRADSTSELLAQFGISRDVMRHIAQFRYIESAKTSITENRSEIAQVRAAVEHIDADAAERACHHGPEVVADDFGNMVVVCQSPELTPDERQTTAETLFLD